MFTTKSIFLCIILTLFLVQNDVSNKPCKNFFPAIAVTSNGSIHKSIFSKKKLISTKYGELITVACHGNTTRLSMKKDGRKVLTENNDVVIFARFNPDQSSKFACYDSGYDCERSVTVHIVQELKVMSSCKITTNNSTYTIHYRCSVDVTCFGLGRYNLTKNGRGLPTENNGTAIRWFEENSELQSSELVCIDVANGYNTSVTVNVVPLINIQTGNETVRILYQEDGTPVYPVTYGDDFKVFCSGDTFKHIYSDNQEVTVNGNGTTVVGIIKHFNKAELIVNCTANNVSARIKVVPKPRLHVSSQNIQRIGRPYVIKYGDRAEVFCSAPTTKKLIMRHRHDYSPVVNLPFITINETTIKYVINKPDVLVNIGHNVYACLLGKAMGRADIELYPEVEHFRCISYDLRYINCTWIALNHLENITLSYMENGIAIQICVQQIILPGPVFYVWHKHQYPVGYKHDKTELKFVLQSCNYFGCFNQTFLIEHMSVLKLNPPWKLRVYGKSSHSVRLSWYSTFFRFGGDVINAGNGKVVHKVEYWYSGIQPLEVNTSQISCDKSTCQFELQLPCPGHYYEVWVYEKLARISDEFWSEPNVLTFYTDDDNTRTDEVCSQKPVKTKDVMIYFVQELREHVRLDIQRMIDVKSLKDKREKIQKYLRGSD